MIVAGTVTKKMAPQVVRLYNQMPEPKYVIAMGACAISGGPFKQGYNVLKGIDRYIPVDVHIPGCPPRPEALLHAFMTLQKKIEEQASDRPEASASSRSGCSRANFRCREFGEHDLGAAEQSGSVAAADQQIAALNELHERMLRSNKSKRGSKPPCPARALKSSRTAARPASIAAG